MTYEQIKNYYTDGDWSKKMVRKAVSLGYITEAQYKVITGETY